MRRAQGGFRDDQDLTQPTDIAVAPRALFASWRIEAHEGETYRDVSTWTEDEDEKRSGIVGPRPGRHRIGCAGRPRVQRHPDYDQERDHASVKSSIEDLARHLQHGVGQPVRLVLTQNAERVGERVRTGQFDVLLAPPHIVGLAMRHHYVPVARSQNKTQVVLVARPDVRVASLNEARNREVVLPHRESLVSYMVRGELNAMGTTPARHFGSVHYMQRYAAVLYAMDIGQAELAAVKGDVLREWNARGHQARIVQTLAETPQAGVAVRDQLDARTKDAIQRAFVNLPAELKTRLVRAGLASEYVHATSRDFEHVSTRGYFTPEVLPGATIVTAHQVRDLMTKGVPLYDVRPPSHYRQGHIPKSINVPYELNSPKEPDADLSIDRIDLSQAAPRTKYATHRAV
jgi:ABC-type phosphate/phosphonate transport system substrate-binding protein